MFDLRCLALTVQRNTAYPKLVSIQHHAECKCQSAMLVTHKRAIAISGINYGNHNCPCGLPQHKGMCKDALLEAQGREPPKWKA